MINWGHPLAPMLRIAFLFNEGKGANVQNLVRPGLSTSGLTITDTTNITWSAGASGLCLKDVANAGASAATFSLAAAIASGSPFTIETRLRPTSLTDNFQALLTLGNGKGLYLRSTGMLDLYTGSASVIISTVALPTAKWTHVVVTWQNSIARTYLNGRLHFSGTHAGVGSWGINTLFNDASSETYDGAMEYMRFWNRALAPSEAAELFVDPYGMFYPTGPLVRTPTAVAGATFPALSLAW